MGAGVDLSGIWRAVLADDARRRDYHDPDSSDADWSDIAVPGHWRRDPAFADSDGPLLLRTTFADPGRYGPGADQPDAPAPDGQGGASTRRSWLVLDGVFYTSDVWLDGSYLGDTEGYFFPHEFEVTEEMAERREHLLALEVACPHPGPQRAKRNLTGSFQDGALVDPGWNPGGVWRPVRLEQTGPVRITHCRATCRDVTDQTATIALRLVLDAVGPEAIDIVTTISPHRPGGSARSGLDGTEHHRRQTLAAGENRVEWTVAVVNPRRWWPRVVGDQPLYDVAVEVRVADGPPSDRREIRMGLRTVELRNWITHVNGERLFLKGADQGPIRSALAEATRADFERDIGLATAAGLDLLRVHAHISRPELYEVADEAGMLLWQDLPMQWGYSRSVRRQARRQAREAVDLLAHHPSVLLWCGHNEPVAVDLEAEGRAERRRRRGVLGGSLSAQALPTWNRSLLDRAVKGVLERNDGTRPVVAHSGVLPHFPQFEGSDSHLWFGWYTGTTRDLPGFLARWPRMARFVSEFGAQAVPSSSDFLDPPAWPHLDWAGLAEHRGMERAVFERRVPPAAFATFEAWREESQLLQARLIRYHVETLRRLKYRPTGGFALFAFADAAPAVGFTVLDHERVAKAGYHALAEACQPVIVVADRPPEEVHPGEELHLEVHVVSDARIAHSDIIVGAHLCWGTEDRRVWNWQGDIPADECVRVGTLDLEIPDHDGPLTLDLRLRGDGLDLSRRYGTWVRPARDDS